MARSGRTCQLYQEPSTDSGNKETPHKLFFGTKAKIARLEEFGSELWVLDQSGQTWKLDAKSHKYRFMGYGDNSRVFRYYKPNSW
jgi:hypothetical protein